MCGMWRGARDSKPIPFQTLTPSPKLNLMSKWRGTRDSKPFFEPILLKPKPTPYILNPKPYTKVAREVGLKVLVEDRCRLHKQVPFWVLGFGFGI